MNKDKKVIVGLIIIIIVLIVGWVSFNLGRNSKEKDVLPLVENNLPLTPNNIPQENQNNIFINHNSKGFSFNYLKTWQIYEVNNSITIDPKKVFSAEELQKVDMPSGLISFSNNQNESNTNVIGYNTFPVVHIGKDGKIEARKFEKYYATNAPEVSLQGKHTIEYFIGENRRINYYGEYNDSYLNDFNQIINSLEIQ